MVADDRHVVRTESKVVFVATTYYLVATSRCGEVAGFGACVEHEHLVGRELVTFEDRSVLGVAQVPDPRDPRQTEFGSVDAVGDLQARETGADPDLLDHEAGSRVHGVRVGGPLSPNGDWRPSRWRQVCRDRVRRVAASTGWHRWGP
jgi:hypothetical protein